MDLSTLLNDLDSLVPEITEPAPIPKERTAEQKAEEAHKRAAKAHMIAEALQGPHEELEKEVKRKVSDVVAAPPNEKKAAAEELLNVVIEQRGYLSEIYKASKLSLLGQFNYGALPEEEFFERLRDIQHKERELFAGDVTIDRNRERVLRNIQGFISQHRKDEEEAGQEVARLFLNILAHKSVDREAEQKMFRKDLIGHYECQPGGWKTDIWCPIHGGWFPFKKMKVAHLVPFKLGYQTMGDLFEEENRGHELMWSMGNGMMMHRDFEEAYDEHIFCLLPIEKPGQPDGWKLVLINEEKRFQKITGKEVWDDYDGKELEFLNDQRPSRRFLYFHYFFCIYRAMQERTKGWRTARDKTKTRKLWATPGPYLRVSMLKKLVEVIGDEVELPEELLADGEITEAKPLEEKIEALDVKDLTSALLSAEDFEAAESEDECD
jgi:HNH endonuclease